MLAGCLLFAVAACGDDDDEGPGDLGLACDNDAQCQGRCVEGGDFPGGMCTFACGDDADCPAGSACVNREGGICGVTCEVHSNCESFGFGPDYGCFETDREGAGGDVRVCRAD